jgi:hypothetical protein
LLGEPHFIETDSTRTYGGDEDSWAFVLPSGQRCVVLLRVPYDHAIIYADPPALEPVLSALGIPAGEPRLQRAPEPEPVMQA